MKKSEGVHLYTLLLSGGWRTYAVDNGVLESGEHNAWEVCHGNNQKMQRPGLISLTMV